MLGVLPIGCQREPDGAGLCAGSAKSVLGKGGGGQAGIPTLAGNSTWQLQTTPGHCKSMCMNSMQTGLMPCATFKTVPFQ
jgi:hypothetical protein